jgi:acyl carrier protein
MGNADSAAVLVELREILADTLQLGARSKLLDAGSALLGSIPELDSMAVVTVMTAIEERFGITIGDDEVSAETFSTLGSLAAFVGEKIGA